MSYFDDASLVMIPSGYKTSKVYSVKPTDGSGDLTFSRSNDTATRVASNGLIERVRTNFCRFSQNFASWTLQGTPTRTTGVTDPNGGTTAATISNVSTTGDFTSGIRLDSNPMTIGAGGKITASVYLKGSGTIGIALERSVSGTYFFETTMVTLTSSWVRYTFSPTIANAADGFQIYVANTTGSTATSFDIAFVQVEQGDIATDYIATTTAAVSVGPVANVPRLDYLNSSCPRLLLEPQRTNWVPYSERLEIGYAFAYVDGLTITQNTTETLDPFGYYGAEKFQTTTGGRADSYSGAMSGLQQVHSIFAKAGTANSISIECLGASGTQFQATFNLTNGTVTSTSGTPTVSGVQSYGNGWYRCYVGGIGSTSAHVKGLVVNGTGSVYMTGWMWEEGNYPTSYIGATLGAAVTRGADACSKTGISSLIGQSEGTFFAEFTIPESQSPSFFSISDGTSANRIIFGYYLGVIRYYTNSATGSFFMAGVIDAAPVVGQTYKIAIAYKANDFKVYKNGSNTNTETTFTVPASLTALDNEGGGVGQNIHAGVKQLLLFKTRLTNAQLAELTTL